MNEGEEPGSDYGKEQLREILKSVEDELAVGGTSEYRKILISISRIASHLESERGTIGRLILRMNNQERLIMGDEKTPGIKSSMDALILEMKHRKKINYGILVSAVSFLVMKFFELITAHH